MLKNKKQFTRRVALAGVSLLLIFTLLATAFSAQQVSASGLAATCSRYHTVASGETISSIALKYNITVQELAEANNLKSPYTIYIGQSLCIPGTTEATATSSTSSKSKDPVMEVTPDRPGYINVAAANMKPKVNYFVRLDNRDRDGSLYSVKIGYVRIDKTGEGGRTFRLPKEFRNVEKFFVCLKHPNTDDVICTEYTQDIPKKNK